MVKKRKIIILVVFVVLLPIFIVAILNFKTLLMVSEFVPMVKEAKLFSRLTKEPKVTEIVFNSQGEPIKADLWDPNTAGKHAAAILILGVDIKKNDPRNKLIADRLARMGVATLVPEITSLVNRRVSLEGSVDLVNAFKYLEKNEKVDSKRIGFMTFCAAGAPALIAAADSEIAGKIKFLNMTNPFIDIRSIYEPLVSNVINMDGKTSHYLPEPKTVEIYNREVIDIVLDSEKDRLILNKYFVDIPQENLAQRSFAKLTQEEQLELSEKGKLVLDFLANKEPDKSDEYLERVNSFASVALDQHSPIKYLNNVEAEIYLVADKNNRYVPFSQSKELELVAKKLGKEVNYFETNLVPGGELSWNFPIQEWPMEIFRLISFTSRFFKEI